MQLPGRARGTCARPPGAVPPPAAGGLHACRPHSKAAGRQAGLGGSASLPSTPGSRRARRAGAHMLVDFFGSGGVRRALSSPAGPARAGPVAAGRGGAAPAPGRATAGPASARGAGPAARRALMGRASEESELSKLSSAALANTDAGGSGRAPRAAPSGAALANAERGGCGPASCRPAARGPGGGAARARAAPAPTPRPASSAAAHGEASSSNDERLGAGAAAEARTGPGACAGGQPWPGGAAAAGGRPGAGSAGASGPGARPRTSVGRGGSTSRAAAAGSAERRRCGGRRARCFGFRPGEGVAGARTAMSMPARPQAWRMDACSKPAACSGVSGAACHTPTPESKG